MIPGFEFSALGVCIETANPSADNVEVERPAPEDTVSIHVDRAIACQIQGTDALGVRQKLAGDNQVRIDDSTHETLRRLEEDADLAAA
jgi:hypothetical protein